MTNGERIDLLSNETATAAAKIWPGGKGRFLVEATGGAPFTGGGTISLEQQSPNGTWLPIEEAALTENKSVFVHLPPGKVRAAVTGTIAAGYAYLVAVTG